MLTILAFLSCQKDKNDFFSVSRFKVQNTDNQKEEKKVLDLDKTKAKATEALTF